MLRKSLKYVFIATANLIVLTALLALWTDRLELIFNDLVRPREFLRILGLTILSLIGMGILVLYLNKKGNLHQRSKLIWAILLTLLISSFLYVHYSKKIIRNAIKDKQFRNELSQKIELANGNAKLTSAKNLTNKEYQQICRMSRFPKLPIEATNITYSYEYEGFLPDYSLSLVYDLPTEMNVETIDYDNGNFSKYQTFEVINNKKRVTYNETQR